MEWFQELYDDFRQRTGFGSLPPERTRRDVDFIVAECGLAPGDRVLDLCSGTGRHSIELERRGIRATGFELNPEYVGLARARARDAGVTPGFSVADVRSAEFGAGFNAAIVMWNSFGYFTDPENLALLQRVGRSLEPGGRFVLELLNRDFILRTFEARVERKMEGVRILEEREFDVISSRVRSLITRYEGGAVVQRRTDWRLYSAHELVAMASGVGFELRAAYNDLDRRPLTLETRLMRLVFEKRRF